MEPVQPASEDVSPAFARRFRERAAATDGVLSFADFMELALYDPDVGYYTAARQRVGRGGETDFYTASSLDAVFGPLVAAAAAQLIGGAERARACSFIEIGAEPGGGALAETQSVFMESRVARLGEPPAIPSRAIVFSNELFDAQPFHRVVRRNRTWIELGVRLADGNGNGTYDRLQWSELPALSPEVASYRAQLPARSEEGYTIDLPIRARTLLDRIVTGAWSGTFIACDYGHTWRRLVEDVPQGTGRAYFRHTLSGELLSSPGEQDLTCHVCWDWLEDSLRSAGFKNVTRESQEAFFVHHASHAIQRIMESDRNPLSRTRTQLKQLLHPGLLGQKFEVLWGIRD